MSFQNNNNKGEMNGVQSKQGGEAVEWKVGLVNCEGKYLTAETFGCKINASGTTMRKKQLWVIEHDGNVVYIKSHLNRYLTTDKKGVATCDSEEKGNAQKFEVEYSKEGKWAFKSLDNSYYFGGTADELKCYEKKPTKSEWWTIRLAIHPQVNLKNVGRKKYAHLSLENQKIQCDELIPWGQDALITLEFIEGGSGGKYAVKSCDDKYLSKTGDLISEQNPKGNKDILFDLEIHSSGQYSGIAFKDNDNFYLTAIGKDAVMQSKNKASLNKDELFTLEDSHPQVFITAHNGKMVSIKQGIDLTANQDELSDTETFQMEFNKGTNNWRFRTSHNKYWVLSEASGITNSGNDCNPQGLFDIEWLETGQVAIKSAGNGKYISAKPNGSLYAVNDNSDSEKARYHITIMNRPLLVLKCDYGFVGFKSSSNPRIECNKAGIDVIGVEKDDEKRGVYYLKGHNGKYWSVDGEGMINADSSEQERKQFRFEMRKQSRFTIKAPNGNYIKGEQNGIVSAKSPELSKATDWEY